MSAFAFSLAEMAKLTGIENLSDLLRKKETTIIAYAVDDKGSRDGQAPCFQTHLNYKDRVGRKSIFSLSYNYHDQSRAIVFEFDPRKMGQITITGFEGKLDTSDGRWTTWLATDLDLLSGQLTHSRKHMFSGICAGHIDLAQLILDARKAAVAEQSAEIAKGNYNSEDMSNIIGLARRIGKAVGKGNEYLVRVRDQCAHLADTITKADTNEDFHRAAAELYRVSALVAIDIRQKSLDASKQEHIKDTTPSPTEINQLKSAVPPLVPEDPQLYRSYVRLICDTVKKVSELSRINFVHALATGDQSRSVPILLLNMTHAFQPREARRAAAG